MPALGSTPKTVFIAWREIRLHGGTGYRRKLAFAMRKAVDGRSDAVIAVVDRDRAGRQERIRQLRNARDHARSQGVNLPAACGQADPHAEAWLLDDAEAVKRALQLSATASVPSAVAGDPKQLLEALHSQSPRATDGRIDVWCDIASQVTESRCRSPEKTGFSDFMQDVRRELRPLARGSNATP